MAKLGRNFNNNFVQFINKYSTTYSISQSVVCTLAVCLSGPFHSFVSVFLPYSKIYLLGFAPITEDGP